MIDAMLGKVGGHSMFAGGGALKRLQMCADCRVVDMMNAQGRAQHPRLPQMSDADRDAVRAAGVAGGRGARQPLRPARAPVLRAAGRELLIAELRHAAPPRRTATPLTAEGAALKSAWARLVEACAGAFPARLEEEHLQLFVGVGKAEVTPYLSAYIERAEGDNPLARLRGQLAEWGLARREEAVEPEDHVSALCETMRWLIVGRKAGLEVQRQFFERVPAFGGLAFLQCGNCLRGYEVLSARGAHCCEALLDVEHKAFEIE